MNIKILAGAIVFVLVLVVGTIAITGDHNTRNLINASTTAQGSGSLNQTGLNSSKVLFSNTQYASYSYLIYPGQISSQAQSALAGFNMTSTTLQNSSAQIKLTPIGSNQYQSLLLKPDYKLYIIETTFGDDGYHFDSSLGDDGFVVVDPNGYVAS